MQGFTSSRHDSRHPQTGRHALEASARGSIRALVLVVGGAALAAAATGCDFNDLPFMGGSAAAQQEATSPLSPPPGAIDTGGDQVASPAPQVPTGGTTTGLGGGVTTTAAPDGEATSAAPPSEPTTASPPAPSSGASGDSGGSSAPAGSASPPLSSSPPVVTPTSTTSSSASPSDTGGTELAGEPIASQPGGAPEEPAIPSGDSPAEPVTGATDGGSGLPSEPSAPTAGTSEPVTTDVADVAPSAASDPAASDPAASDPAAGAESTPTEPGAPAYASLNLAWEAPVTNTDGTLLSDLGGYRIYDGPEPGLYTHVTDVGTTTSETLDSLPSGTYYFSVTAYDLDGNESDFSPEVAATLE